MTRGTDPPPVDRLPWRVVGAVLLLLCVGVLLAAAPLGLEKSPATELMAVALATVLGSAGGLLLIRPESRLR
jgi:hypothetical protein